jgi:GDPmannose 4,6-dehydratase
MPVAIVTGANGQDGSYLCEELLTKKEYRVVGYVRPRTTLPENLQACLKVPNFKIRYGDLLEEETLWSIINTSPEELYHLGALSHVGHSFHTPTLYYDTNARATIRLLELLRYTPETRFYFAGTSEMFPKNPEHKPQHEEWALGGNSPYALAKTAAFLACQHYRSTYNLHISTGIAFNHESPRRSPAFVTQKLVYGLKHYKATREQVRLASDHTVRDWHDARDTVRAMWMMLQMDRPGDYVLASGAPRSVRDFGHEVSKFFEVDYNNAVILDPSGARPSDVPYLCGDPWKAENVLGWKRRYSFEDMVRKMCEEA